MRNKISQKFCNSSQFTGTLEKLSVLSIGCLFGIGTKDLKRLGHLWTGLSSSSKANLKPTKLLAPLVLHLNTPCPATSFSSFWFSSTFYFDFFPPTFPLLTPFSVYCFPSLVHTQTSAISQVVLRPHPIINYFLY